MDDTTRPSLRRTFFVLASLNILSNITVPLTGLVDRGMLGHLDDLRFLDGVALGAIIFDYLYWSFGFLRMGTTGVVAQAHGRQDDALIWNTLYRGLLLGTGIALVLLLLRNPLVELSFHFLGGSAGVQQAGRDYYHARIWGAPATFGNYVILGVFLGQARSGVVLSLTLIANLANLLLNYVFIVRMGLAAQGAGLATMLSQYLMLVAAIGFLVASRPRAPRWSEIFQGERLRALMSLNSALMLRTLFLLTAFALFNQFGVRLGEETLAVNALLFGLFLFASFAIDGIAYAVQSLAGSFWAQGDMSRLRETVKVALTSSLLVGLAAVLPMLLFRRSVMGLLTHHTAIIESGAALMPWLFLVVVSGALAFVFDGLFISLSLGTEMRNSMALSFCCGFLPLAYIALQRGSNELLWAALVAFMVLRSISQGWIYIRRIHGLSPPSPLPEKAPS